jgi:hypothetical protein
MVVGSLHSLERTQLNRMKIKAETKLRIHGWRRLPPLGCYTERLRAQRSGPCGFPQLPPFHRVVNCWARSAPTLVQNLVLCLLTPTLFRDNSRLGNFLIHGVKPEGSMEQAEPCSSHRLSSLWPAVAPHTQKKGRF